MKLEICTHEIEKYSEDDENVFKLFDMGLFFTFRMGLLLWNTVWIWVKIGGEELLTASLSDCGADGWNSLDGFRLLFSEKAKLLNAGLLFAWGLSI